MYIMPIGYSLHGFSYSKIERLSFAVGDLLHTAMGAALAPPTRLIPNFPG